MGSGSLMAILPLELFDSDSFDIYSPEEWISLSTPPGGRAPSIAARARHPVSALVRTSAPSCVLHLVCSILCAPFCVLHLVRSTFWEPSCVSYHFVCVCVLSHKSCVLLRCVCAVLSRGM